MTDQIDDIDKLSYQLEQVQKLHADSLRELQETEGKLLDKSAYNFRRKLITEAHEEASRKIAQQIEETQETTRRNLALGLRYEGDTETERKSWAEAIRLVEGADTIQKQEELVHRALRWGDKALARALVFKFGSQAGYQAMHEVLAGVDDRIKATFDFERKHGNYKKKGASANTWAGWQTIQRQQGSWSDVVDIPGRPAHLQPGYLKQQRRAELEQRNSNNK